MDALSLSPLAPATFSAVSTLRPVQPLPVQEDKASGSRALAIQDLAQGLFQQALQASILSPLSEPSGGNVGLAREATTSLFASLSAPQAPASTTSATDATTNAITRATPSTAPSASPPAAVLADVPTAQDAYATSSTLDFAMQAALRFGAGIAGLGTPTLPSADLGPGLIRDAATVQRLGSLQTQAGAPGSEAFTLPQAATTRLLRTYEVTPAPAISPGSNRVDLFA